MVHWNKIRTGTHWATGWKRPEINSYLLYLWQDGLPSGHKDVFLQRGHIAGWVVNSLFSVIVCGAFPSKWNGLSSKSLFYSLESCRTLERVLLCHCNKQHAGWARSNLLFGAEFSFHLNRSLPTAQLKRPFWSSFWLRLCVDNLTHSWGLTIWERKQLWCYMCDISHTVKCSNA